MEELPPELVSQIYPHMSPISYRRFRQTGSRYQEISEDPYMLKQTEVIIKDPSGEWATKTNIKGCMNSLSYSSERKVNENDLVDNMFIFEYLYGPIIFSGKCPFDQDGYLDGIMDLSINYGGINIILKVQIPIVHGFAHGNVKILTPQLSNREHFEFDHGILNSQGSRGIYLGYDSFGTTYFRIYYNENFIVEEITMNSISRQSIVLPKSFTKSNIRIVIEDDVRDKVLPLGLFNCRNLDSIQQDVQFLINRLFFYICNSIYVGEQ